MKITNRAGLPEAIVKACTTRRHNNPGRLSATTLLNGTKQIVLTDRHWDELEEDVADRFWAIFGTAAHSVLEHEGKYDFAEEFMSHEMDGITVTGRIDNYNMQSEVVSDYKTCSIYKIKSHDFEDWRRQGLIYAWLLIKNGFKVKTCRFIAIIKDHSKREAKRDPFYPQVPLYVYEVVVTEEALSEIEAFIKAKIADYHSCRQMADDAIPSCTAKERWEKPPKFAVKKNGNKRATKVWDEKEDAEKHVNNLGAGYSIEERPGESVRCQGYCSCCDFCSFYRDNIAAAEEQEAVSA